MIDLADAPADSLPPQSLLGLLVLLLVGAFVTPATAHDLPRERTIMVELSPDSVRAMVLFQEPPGRRIKLLKAQFDFDGDGELRGAEAEAAASSWVPYALRDLTFRIDGGSPDRETAKLKFKNEHHGSLSSAIYLEWDVPGLEPGRTRTITVRRSDDAPPFRSPVRCQVIGDVDVTEAPGPVDDGETGPFPLEPGSSVSFAAVRPRAAAPLPTRRP